MRSKRSRYIFSVVLVITLSAAILIAPRIVSYAHLRQAPASETIAAPFTAQDELPPQW
jgi:hypothetical protein